MLWILFLYILSLDVNLTDSACTNALPLSSGTWKTSNRGTWVVNSLGTQISGFEVIISTAEGTFTVIMECDDDTSDTDGYILLKSTTTKFALGGNKYIYACVKFTESSTSSNAFEYALGSDPTTLAVGIYERIVLLDTAATFSFDTKCTDKSTAAERTHMAIKDGTVSSAAITCPTSIQGTFTYSGTSCTTTYLDTCSTRTQFVFNYTLCAETQFFSAGGVLHCVYSTTANGYNYLTLYNDDASPTYQYACLVYTTSDKIVRASINPEECFDSSLQTPTSTVHANGVTRTLTNDGSSVCYTTSPSSSSLVWLYVLIAIIIIIIIIVIIILVYCYLKRRKKRQKKSDEESLHPSIDDEQKQKDDEKKTTPKEEKKSTKEEEKKTVKVQIKEEDRTSIDSGIEQEKKYDKRAEKDKKVVIEDRKEEKDKIKVKEQEEEKEKEEKDETTDKEEQEGEEEGSESEESATSSRVTTPDPEEIERNIRKIGMMKTTDFKPQGELSKVLVSRKMEEESRSKKEKGKWNKMKNLFRVKTKKIKDLSQNKDRVNKKGEQQTDSEEEEEKPKVLNNVTPFLEQYNYKKNMEKQLDEQHVWGGEEDYAERLKDSDDEEFADIFKDDNNKNGEKLEHEKTEIEMLDLKTKKAKHAKGKADNEYLQDITDDEKRLKEKEDQAKDSGVDSPDLKKEKTDINYTENDDEMHETEMTEPPPGFIKDSAGRIIRLYDNKVMTEEEMQSIFPLAKLGMLFHVPRLKRTSHGRPTGEYIEDKFGPKLEQDKEGASGDSKDEHPKAKHPRSSRGSARREQKEALPTKTVAFLDDGQSDILMIDDDYVNGERRPSDANRELLRKRLFRNKRKPRSRGGEKMILSDEGRPRELSDLVRIIPQTGQKYGANGRTPIPGTVISRNDSVKNKYDPEQQQMYREGLAADKKILERSPSLKRPPTVPKQAFADNDPDDIRISIDNEENEARLRSRNGVNIGSDDEFFLVGHKESEPFFTRRHDQTVRPLPGSDMFCPKHDMRHALPWSLINQYHIRESSVLNLNKDKKETTAAPKSADNAKRNLDDRRLRELLEELYKDKKYFDHMIDTTEPNVEPVIDERDLAEHGRDFLLERAEYWDERGVRIPRPPQSELGLRLSRMQTFVPDSGRVSNISYASTTTPQPRPEHLPPDKPKDAFQRREHTIS